MKQKTYVSPISLEDMLQPLAVVRLPWKKAFWCAAALMALLWGVVLAGTIAQSSGGTLQTEHAVFVRQSITTPAELYFFRDELPLYVTETGLLVPQHGAGERVGSGQTLAVQCENSRQAELLTQEQILLGQRRWLIEASAAAQYNALDANQIERQLNEIFVAILRKLEQGDHTGLAALQDSFTHKSANLEAALGELPDLSEELAATNQELQTLREEIRGMTVHPIRAPQSGTFYPTTDGLEERCAPNRLATLTSEQLTSLIRDTPSGGTLQAQCIGKLVLRATWYAATLLPVGEIQNLREGQTYIVSFPQDSARSFSMRIESIRRDTHANETSTLALMILSTNETDDALFALRSAKAEIHQATVEGLRIPAAALRFLEKGEGLRRRAYTGVYIHRMGKLQLREVQVLHQTQDYAMVAWGEGTESVALVGDTVTIQGRILSVTEEPEESGKQRLLVIGKDLRLTASESAVPAAISDKLVERVTLQTPLFDEVMLSAEDLHYIQQAGTLVLNGEGLRYREVRGAGLRIYDNILVRGRIPEESK